MVIDSRLLQTLSFKIKKQVGHFVRNSVAPELVRDAPLSDGISPFVLSRKELYLDRRVQKVQRMMRDSPSERRSLGEYAESVNLSVWRLCRIFRAQTGMSPIEYLRSLKMERARQLLQTSFLSVRDIARQVGLGDASHFVRDFKNTYGVTPAQYRNMSEGRPVKNLTKRIARAAKRANK